MKEHPADPADPDNVAGIRTESFPPARFPTTVQPRLETTRLWLEQPKGVEKAGPASMIIP